VVSYTDATETASPQPPPSPMSGVCCEKNVLLYPAHVSLFSPNAVVPESDEITGLVQPFWLVGTDK